MTVDYKNRAYQLSKKLFNPSGEVNLTPNDRELLKSRIEKIYNNPMYYGFLLEVLYPEDKEVELPEEDKALSKSKK